MSLLQSVPLAGLDLAEVVGVAGAGPVRWCLQTQAFSSMALQNLSSNATSDDLSSYNKNNQCLVLGVQW